MWQLGILHDALDRLDALHEKSRETLNNLPAHARPGTRAFDDALAEHHAECWSHLDDWATHGQAIVETNAAARHAPSPLALRPAATAAPSTSLAGTVRR